MRPSLEEMPYTVPRSVTRRLLFEAWCFYLVFIPYRGNHFTRKLLTSALTFAAIGIVIGDSFGIADPPDYFLYMLLFVGIIIGRMWGIQFRNLAGIEVQHDDDSGK